MRLTPQLDYLVVNDGENFVFAKDIADEEKREKLQFRTLVQAVLLDMMIAAGELGAPLECIEVRYVLGGVEFRVHMKKPTEKTNDRAT
jgi:hypothetical protein